MLRLASALAVLTLTLPSQIPGHATVINPIQEIPRPRIIHDGDTLHAVTPNLYARSADGGRTWPQVERMLGLAPTMDLATGPGYVIAIGPVFDWPTLRWSLAVVRSTDGGIHWGAPVTVQSPQTPQIAEARVHCDGNNVVAVWTMSEFPGRLLSSRSTDGGLTWPTTPTRLDPSATVSHPLTRLATIVDWPQLYVFCDYWPGAQVVRLQQVSSDGGQTWMPTARLRPFLQGAAGPSAFGGAGRLYYLEGQTLNMSQDGGLTWVANTVPGLIDIQDVVASGPLVVAVGRDSPTGGPTSYGIWVSLDGGFNWPGAWSAASFPGFTGQAHIADSGLYVLFQHATPSAAMLIRSVDVGMSWQVVQREVDVFAPGPRRNVHLMRTPSTLPNIFRYHAFVGTGYSVTGSGSAGAGGIAPRLRQTGLPFLGTATTLDIEDAVGGSLALFGVATLALQPVSLGAATLWLQGPLAIATTTTSGPAGAAGVGVASSPLTVPNLPALVGASVTAQGLVLDAAAPLGFTLTNAIEVWLR